MAIHPTVCFWVFFQRFQSGEKKGVAYSDLYKLFNTKRGLDFDFAVMLRGTSVDRKINYSCKKHFMYVIRKCCFKIDLTKCKPTVYPIIKEPEFEITLEVSAIFQGRLEHI